MPRDYGLGYDEDELSEPELDTPPSSDDEAEEDEEFADDEHPKHRVTKKEGMDCYVVMSLAEAHASKILGVFWTLEEAKEAAKEDDVMQTNYFEQTRIMLFIDKKWIKADDGHAWFKQTYMGMGDRHAIVQTTLRGKVKSARGKHVWIALKPGVMLYYDNKIEGSTTTIVGVYSSRLYAEVACIHHEKETRYGKLTDLVWKQKGRKWVGYVNGLQHDIRYCLKPMELGKVKNRWVGVMRLGPPTYRDVTRCSLIEQNGDWLDRSRWRPVKKFSDTEDENSDDQERGSEALNPNDA